MDLTLHAARLVGSPDETVDIGVSGGKSVEIAKTLAPGGRAEELDGRRG